MLSKEKVGHYNGGPSNNGSKVGGSSASQILASSIEAAHENGELFSLAAHLKSLMEEYQVVDGPHTTVELEVLIALAARAMVSP
jgi:hypothetical protein